MRYVEYIDRFEHLVNLAVAYLYATHNNQFPDGIKSEWMQQGKAKIWYFLHASVNWWYIKPGGWMEWQKMSLYDTKRGYVYQPVWKHDHKHGSGCFLPPYLHLLTKTLVHNLEFDLHARKNYGIEITTDLETGSAMAKLIDLKSGRAIPATTYEAFELVFRPKSPVWIPREWWAYRRLMEIKCGT